MSKMYRYDEVAVKCCRCGQVVVGVSKFTHHALSQRIASRLEGFSFCDGMFLRSRESCYFVEACRPTERSFLSIQAAHGFSLPLHGFET